MQKKPESECVVDFERRLALLSGSSDLQTPVAAPPPLERRAIKAFGSPLPFSGLQIDKPRVGCSMAQRL
ncbi:hypothetical protein L596_000278 [Steinernema carpocapsae]|uniref:Uncharacterized protein n=1 Tax=Steinernema carpocapsae TaxID=34508 RepID=A0A4U8UHV5_STECR|nr:hypothetical protein L596_000278 [Steinernema carpocapsae]